LVIGFDSLKEEQKMSTASAATSTHTYTHKTHVCALTSTDIQSGV